MKFAALLAIFIAPLALAGRTRRDGALRPRASVTAGDYLDDPQQAIDREVKQVIQQDVAAALKQFKGLPDYVANVVQQAVKLPLSQAITNLSATEQLERLSTQINNKLASIQEDVVSDILNLEPGLGDDTANFAALQACIAEIVKQGGLQEGQSCLSESNFAMSSLASQFSMFVNLNDFDIPAAAINAATANITKFLDDNVLYPGAEALIAATQGAIQNVQLAQAATERDAALASFNCFITAIQQISQVSLQKRYLQCDLGNTEAVPFQKSTLARVEQSYFQAVDQYSGVLPPTIVTQVQAIGLQALSLSLDPYQNSTRNAINAAILSNVAETSGLTATLARSLASCLNTMLDLDDTNTCDPEVNVNIVQANYQIYNNYLAQFVSTLPKVLVENLRQKTSELAAETGLTEAEIRTQLDELFKQASLGTEFETCFLVFEDCVIKGIRTGISAANTTCDKGDQCQNLPALTPTRLSGTSPYAGIAGKRLRSRKRLLFRPEEKAIFRQRP